MFPLRISVIVPVYNCEEYLPDCLASLLAQSMPQHEFEVLLIDDGSSDNSAAVCRALAEGHDNVHCFSKPNGGVSSTRNFGIEHAAGKYFLFLDADDTLTPDTLETLADFFDAHYDEVDMVTYRIVPVRGERRFPVHYRYRVLKETGVYDLNEPENWYLCQTTMNICVKNLGQGNNILFDTSLIIHEDQKYSTEVLLRKMKLGFCKGPEYLYLRHAGSATNTKEYAYYIFEKTTALWENFFSRYPAGKVPPYLQGMYLNDIDWKTTKDCLLPYHYKGEKFTQAVERLTALLRCCNDEVIMDHPRMDLYLKFYFLRQKNPNGLSVSTENGVTVFCDGKEIYQEEQITLVITRAKVFGRELMLDGFIKSPVFLFDETPPRVWLTVDGVRREAQVRPSAFCYYHARVKTARFWRVSVRMKADEVSRFSFEVEAFGNLHAPKFYFMPNTCFKNTPSGLSFFLNKVRYSLLPDSREFALETKGARTLLPAKVILGLRKLWHFFKINKRIPVYRMMAAFRPKREIWLYQDRYGVFDNAYEQFLHDADKPDGIKRYYIINDCDLDRVNEKFTPAQQKQLVRFHSMKHKYLYLNCNKLLTSFSNLSNICPFGIMPMRWYYDLIRFELVYLQHGILHASLLNMYAKEHCQVDRVVVSSHFEVENFVQKYGYQPEELIQSGMPRFDFMHPDADRKGKNRILLSPSWRSNLIGNLVENQRQPTEQVFLNSDFYREFSALIQSPELVKLLEENDLYLDFKNHPIFACYNHLFTPASQRITVSSGGTDMDDYRLMITDYSSIVFDAVYMGCPILYFVPDYDKFVAGVSHNYRELDLPLEQGFGPFTQTATELIDCLKECVAHDFEPQSPYRERMDGFFLHRDGHCRDRLYDILKNN